MTHKLARDGGFINDMSIQHINLTECESTQSIFKQYWAQRDSNTSFLLVSSELQTNGHGRRAAKWLSGKKSLAMSGSVRAQETLTLTPLALATGIIKFLRLKNIELTLKWPNDLLNPKGEKFGGLLCQTLENNLVLVGIGLNLYLSNEELEQLKTCDYPVAHLNLKEIDRSAFALELYKNLIAIDDFSIEDWNKACFHLNKTVTITDGDQSISGTFIGIDKNGAAILESQGQHHKVLTGSLRIS